MEQLSIFDFIEIDNNKNSWHDIIMGQCGKYFKKSDHAPYDIEIKKSDYGYSIVGNTKDAGFGSPYFLKDYEDTQDIYNELFEYLDKYFYNDDFFIDFTKRNKKEIAEHKELTTNIFGFQPLNYIGEFLKVSNDYLKNIELIYENSNHKLFKTRNNVCEHWFLWFHRDPYYETLIEYYGIYDNKWRSNAELYYGSDGSLMDNISSNKIDTYSKAIKWYGAYFEEDLTLDELMNICKLKEDS